MISVALVGVWALLVCVSTEFADGEFVLDAHMIYFTTIAMLLAYFCWRSIIAATVVVLAHHLTLNFAAPLLIWPNDNYALRQFLIHGTIVAIITPIALYLATRVSQLFADAEASVEKAELALATANEAEHSQRLMLDRACRIVPRGSGRRSLGSRTIGGGRFPAGPRTRSPT